MTSHDNPACEWFERVWNDNDLSAIATLGTPDMKAHGADGVVRTPDQFADFQRVIRGALPDIHVDVRHCVGGRDMMAVHWFAVGTHTGEAPGLPKPSGQRIEVSGLTLIRLEGGKIAEGWDDFDHPGLMQQLGF